MNRGDQEPVFHDYPCRGREVRDGEIVCRDLQSNDKFSGRYIVTYSPSISGRLTSAYTGQQHIQY